jgi:hypothetical protein
MDSPYLVNSHWKLIGTFMNTHKKAGIFIPAREVTPQALIGRSIRIPARKQLLPVHRRQARLIQP